MSMPVTACGAERNWSKWGQTFVPNRNNLGLDVAQKMIFVQQNDPSARIARGFEGRDVLVEWVLGTSVDVRDPASSQYHCITST